MTFKQMFTRAALVAAFFLSSVQAQSPDYARHPSTSPCDFVDYPGPTSATQLGCDTFTASDFNFSGHVLSLDYTNGPTHSTIVPNTTPSAGQILVGNAGGTAYAPVSMSGDVTITSAGVSAIGTNKVANSQLTQMAAHTLKANITGSTANAVDSSLSAILDAELSSTQGSIIYRGASTWTTLAPSTSGYVLKTLGAGANPAWAAGPGAAGITVGLDKDRPAAASGSIYQATDSKITYLSDLTSWYVAGYGPDKVGFGNISDSNYIQSAFAGAASGPTMANPYTLVIGFKVLATPGTSNQVLIRNFQTSGSDGFFLGTSITNSNKFRMALVGVNSGAANEFTSLTALTTGDHALAVSYNGSSLDMVLDGGTVQAIACTGTYTVPTASAVTSIGRFSTTGTGATGFVFSYVYGYSSALSTADKQTLTTTPSNYFPGVISASPAWAFNAKIPGSGTLFRTWGSAVPSDGSSWLANVGTLKVYSL